MAFQDGVNFAEGKEMLLSQQTHFTQGSIQDWTGVTLQDTGEW